MCRQCHWAQIISFFPKAAALESHAAPWCARGESPPGMGEDAASPGQSERSLLKGPPQSSTTTSALRGPVAACRVPARLPCTLLRPQPQGRRRAPCDSVLREARFRQGNVCGDKHHTELSCLPTQAQLGSQSCKDPRPRSGLRCLLASQREDSLNFATHGDAPKVTYR